MVDLSFPYFYNPALYRVELDKEPEHLVSHHCLPLKTTRSLFDLCALRIVGNASLLAIASPRSLLDLCALRIVGNASLMATARTALPTKLNDSLLKAALLLSNDAVIMQLMSAWPWEDLSLRNFAQPIFNLLNTFLCQTDLHEQMLRGWNHTKWFALCFIECLKRRDSGKLRCLDLTGYPCAENLVEYIACQVLLVSSKAHQRQTIQKCNAATQNLPVEQKREITVPDEKFVFRIDALLRTEDAHMTLCCALKVSRLPESCLKLKIDKLDMAFLGVAKITVLLELLDPEFLTGISLQCNSIFFDGDLALFAPLLKKFTHLTGLDLSSNYCNAMNKGAVILSDILANLPSLQRLDLSKNNINGLLPTILSNTVQSLTMLRMRDCNLTEQDFEYLLHSEHRLEELDISENVLSDCFPLVLLLIRKLSPSLLLLEMENVELQPDKFLPFFETCAQLQNLRLLNVACNDQLLYDALCDADLFFSTSCRLQVVKLSYPTDIEDHDDIDEPQIYLKKKKFSYLNNCDVISLSCAFEHCIPWLAFKT